MSPDPARAALLRAVLEDPSDKLPRLAYADRLEELGEGGRAEFVRKQVRGEKAVVRSRQFRQWFAPWWGTGPCP